MGHYALSEQWHRGRRRRNAKATAIALSVAAGGEREGVEGVRSSGLLCGGVHVGTFLPNLRKSGATFLLAPHNNAVTACRANCCRQKACGSWALLADGQLYGYSSLL